MADEINFEEVEAILRGLQPADLEQVKPPASIWNGIESATGSVPSRELRFVRPLGLAAALVALVAGAGLVWSQVDNKGDHTLATATLTYDPELFDRVGAESSADVALLDNDGRYRIAMTTADLPTTLDEVADLEIWLIEPDETGNVAHIVSLGLIDPNDLGSFDVPDGIDPDRYSVVDISVEPRDGDETHSGRSILRGSLRTT
jgi:anti-sigma-K factor RskA